MGPCPVTFHSPRSFAGVSLSCAHPTFPSDMDMTQRPLYAVLVAKKPMRAVCLPLPGRSWNSGLCARVASSSSARGMLAGVWGLMPGRSGEPSFVT